VVMAAMQPTSPSKKRTHRIGKLAIIVAQLYLAACCSVPSLPASSHHALRQRPIPPPSSGLWLHEIKHDGFRVIARKDGANVRLYSRPGNDLTYRFPLIVESLARLRPRCASSMGRPSPATRAAHPVSITFDIGAMIAACSCTPYLIELNGDDLRRETLEVRKATLATVLERVGHGIWFNDHIEDDGQTVFRHACKLGLEGIVSKRKDSLYRSGRSRIGSR
jgi:bifunctional non-homologous end joining protein LigD